MNHLEPSKMGWNACDFCILITPSFFSVRKHSTSTTYFEHLYGLTIHFWFIKKTKGDKRETVSLYIVKPKSRSYVHCTSTVGIPPPLPPPHRGCDASRDAPKCTAYTVHESDRVTLTHTWLSLQLQILRSRTNLQVRDSNANLALPIVNRIVSHDWEGLEMISWDFDYCPKIST